MIKVSAGLGPCWRLGENAFPPPCQLLEATCMLGSWATSSSVKANYGGGNPSHMCIAAAYILSLSLMFKAP